MDRVSKVSGTYHNGGVTQADRRQNGKAAMVQGNLGTQNDGSDLASGQSYGEQNPAQRHFTEEQARAYYFAQQRDKGQYYAEQQFGERYHAGKDSVSHLVKGKTEQSSNSGQNTNTGISRKRKTTAQKNQEFWKNYTEQKKKEKAADQARGNTAGQNGQQSYYYKPKEYAETGNSILDQLKSKSDAFKNALDPKKKKNLYDATMDLMLVEQAEKTAALKAIQTRLLFKIRSVKASGAEASVIRAAVSKIKKVIGKVKGKIKNLKKEEQLERKRKKAEENRKKEKERALREELERRKKVRKAKERGDVEESKMGLGANYGGPTDLTPSEIATMAYGSVGAVSSAAPAEAGSTVDVAVADVGAVVDAGAVDVSL